MPLSKLLGIIVASIIFVVGLVTISLSLVHLWDDHQIDDQIRAIQRQQIQQLQQQQAKPPTAPQP